MVLAETRQAGLGQSFERRTDRQRVWKRDAEGRELAVEEPPATVRLHLDGHHGRFSGGVAERNASISQRGFVGSVSPELFYVDDERETNRLDLVEEARRASLGRLRLGQRRCDRQRGGGDQLVVASHARVRGRRSLRNVECLTHDASGTSHTEEFARTRKTAGGTPYSALACHFQFVKVNQRSDRGFLRSDWLRCAGSRMCYRPACE